MIWNDGYVADLEYAPDFFGLQDPGRLSCVCAINGFEPVDTGEPFTYFELGCGQGVTAALLAAAHPHGSFHAADFMPAHIAAARRLATEAGLDNLRLLDISFAELAAGKVEVPALDFVTMHGVYSWVTPENRRHIVDFVARYLKPGGIVYVSYNAMPGWSSALPLQRLLLEHALANPNRSDVQMEGARAFVDRLIDAKAQCFTAHASPVLEARLKLLKAKQTTQLAHEYLNRGWQALYHADVARDFQVAKLDFAGTACLSHRFLRRHALEQDESLLAGVADPAWRETMSDYLLNTTFRSDVFVRGARRMSAPRREQWMERIGLALLVPRPAVTLSPPGTLAVPSRTFARALDALARCPRSLSALEPSAGSIDLGIDLASLLSTYGEGTPYLMPAGPRPSDTSAARMNRVIARRAMLEDEVRYLVSPVLGTGVYASHVERLVYHHLQEQPDQRDAAAIAHQVRHALGAQASRDEPATPDEDAARLCETVTGILEWKLPLWQQLGIL